MIVGGGALIGGGTGGAAMMALAATSPEAIMCNCAKIYVVLKEIVLGMQHDKLRFQEVISDLIDKVAALKKEKVNLESELNKCKEKIESLEKLIKELPKCVDEPKKEKEIKEAEEKKYKEIIENLEKCIKYFQDIIDSLLGK